MPNEQTDQTVMDANLAWRMVEHYMKYLMGAPATQLYNYTTEDGLINIICGQELWATQVARLNDTKELIYVVERLQKHVREELALGGETDNRALWEVTDRLLPEARTDTDGTFVACFSTRKYDLSQWRSYSDGASGYAIHFAPMLWQRISQRTIRFARVEYDEMKTDIILRDALKWMRFYVHFAEDHLRCTATIKSLTPQGECPGTDSVQKRNTLL